MHLSIPRFTLLGQLKFLNEYLCIHLFFQDLFNVVILTFDVVTNSTPPFKPHPPTTFSLSDAESRDYAPPWCISPPAYLAQVPA